MKILALGAAGFIGSHLTNRLLNEGHKVTGLDLHSDKIEDALGHPNLTFLKPVAVSAAAPSAGSHRFSAAQVGPSELAL